jgi:hypothetical protein
MLPRGGGESFLALLIYSLPNWVYFDKGGKEWTKTKPFDLYGPDGKPYVEISGLDNSKEYEVATIAGNGEGNSSWSDINTVVPGGSARKYFVKVVFVASNFKLAILRACITVSLLRTNTLK